MPKFYVYSYWVDLDDPNRIEVVPEGEVEARDRDAALELYDPEADYPPMEDGRWNLLNWLAFPDEEINSNA